MNLAKEEKVGYKAPVVMTSMGLLVFWFFGIHGKSGVVSFELSRRQDLILLDPVTFNSQTLGIVAGGLLLAIASVSVALSIRNLKTPVWVSSIYGLIGVIALLGWLATGSAVPVAFIASTAVVLAVPITLGSMAGIMSERVGVTNIAIEGQLLTGAFVAAVVTSLTKSFTLGILSAMLTAAIFSMVLATLALRYLAQQIIVGVVLNVIAIGITNFLFQQLLKEDGENLNFPGTLEIVKIPLLSDIPIFGPIFFEHRFFVFAAFVMVPLLWFVIFKTKLGLRGRAVGEHPLAAETVGVDVVATRFWWVASGGAVAGLGGAALTLGSSGAFGKEMSGGLGFIALAVMILGRWHPVYAAFSALLFGFSIILQIWTNQVAPGIPSDLIAMVPYVVTIIAVVGFVGRSRAPKALAQPYVKG